MTQKPQMRVMVDNTNGVTKPRWVNGQELPDWENGPPMVEYIRNLAKQGWWLTQRLQDLEFLFER